MKKISSVLWGAILVAVGIIFALNALNITDIDVFFDGWWTLFIIVPCVVGLFTERDKTGNLIGILIGVFLLLGCQDVIGFDMLWKLAIPAVIILIGLRMILRSVFGNRSAKVAAKLQGEGKHPQNGFAAFSGSDYDFDGESFYGANLNAVFGGIQCDLRTALIPEDCVIHATAVFGGIDILLPEDVNVKVSSNSAFGGVDNKCKNRKVDGAVTVYIQGSGIFGGVEIK